MSDAGAGAVIVAGLVLVILAGTGIVIVDSLDQQAEPENAGLSEGQQSLTDGFATFSDLMATILVILMVPPLIAAVAMLARGGP